MASRRLHSVVWIVALFLGACSAGAHNLSEAQRFCASDSNGYLEVYIPRAQVVRVLGTRESRSGLHEGFIIEAASSASAIEVEDNADITGPIPLYRGEPISLLGQYECDDGVMHWTHHDPSGRHPFGYIEAGGKRYE